MGQDELGSYDYGARFYDPVIGRWNAPDMLAELAPELSPFRYCYNNPVNYTDPFGLFESRKEARKYRRENKISGQIKKDADGNYSIYDDENSMTYSAGDDSEFEAEIHPNDDVVETVVINGQGSGYGANQGAFENSKTALDIGGGLYGAAEKLVLNGSQWLGKNGKYYSTDWGGNGYTGSRLGALQAAGRYKWAGRAVLVTSVVIGGIETYQGYRADGDRFGYNAQHAAAQTIGSIGGGAAGAALGAEIGGGIGLLFGGVGAIPGAAIGGLIGGIVGGWGGSSLAGEAVDLYH